MLTMKHRLTAAITVYVTADLETEGDDTQVGLVSANHSVMGGVFQLDGSAGETQQVWRDAVALSASKLALRHVLDKLDGKLEEKPPETTQPGARA